MLTFGAQCNIHNIYIYTYIDMCIYVRYTDIYIYIHTVHACKRTYFGLFGAPGLGPRSGPVSSFSYQDTAGEHVYAASAIKILLMLEILHDII